MKHHLICQMCYKAGFIAILTLKPSRPVAPSLLRWQFLLGERTDKHIRKAILVPKNVI